MQIDKAIQDNNQREYSTVVRGVVSGTPRIPIELGTIKNAVHVMTGIVFWPALQEIRWKVSGQLAPCIHTILS